jgi:predicted nucleotidyltransferase
MVLNNELELKERFELMTSYFEENAWDFIFEEHSYVEKIVFFGSFMKGKNTEKSDIDVIFVPSDSFIKETDLEDKIGCLHGIHEDMRSVMAKDIPIDVKLQDYFEDGNQMGISTRTGMWICTDYEFGKGQVSFCVIMDRNQQVTFETL